MFKIHKEEIELDGKKIILETGKIARQADGAIIATCGETVVISTVVGAKRLILTQTIFHCRLIIKKNTMQPEKYQEVILKEKQGQPNLKL